MRLPKKIVDANVILRFFLEDDEQQFPKAKALIQRLELGRDEVLLTELVFAEVVWVLNKVYEVPRPVIAEQFTKLMSYAGIKTLESKEIFSESLRLYARHTIDIQDIFLALLSKRNDCTVVTFNKDDFKKLQCSYSEPE
jgi:predicted nucleic acid-binding protein